MPALEQLDFLGAPDVKAQRHYRKDVLAVTAVLLLMLTAAEVGDSPENMVLLPVSGLSKPWRMAMDLTMHRQHCGDVHVDLANEMNGKTFLDQNTVNKVRVVNNVETTEPAPECQPCGDLGGCCNTCEELKRQFLNEERSLEEVNQQPQCQEGCRVSFDTEVRAGNGSLRIIPAKATVDQNHVTLYQFDIPLLQAYGWNGSHTVNALSYAPFDAPERQVSFAPKHSSLEDGFSKIDYFVTVQDSDMPLPPQPMKGQAFMEPLSQTFSAPLFLMRYSFSSFRLATAPTSAAEWPLWLRLVLLLGGVHGLLRLWYGLQQTGPAAEPEDVFGEMCEPSAPGRDLGSKRTSRRLSVLSSMGSIMLDQRLSLMKMDRSLREMVTGLGLGATKEWEQDCPTAPGTPLVGASDDV